MAFTAQPRNLQLGAFSLRLRRSKPVNAYGKLRKLRYVQVRSYTPRLASNSVFPGGSYSSHVCTANPYRTRGSSAQHRIGDEASALSSVVLIFVFVSLLEAYTCEGEQVRGRNWPTLFLSNIWSDLCTISYTDDVGGKRRDAPVLHRSALQREIRQGNCDSGVT